MKYRSSALNAMVVSVAVCLLLASNAQASTEFALDKGCYSCHGTPPRKNAPTFEHLATDYAKYQGQTDAAAELASKLREGPLFGGIDAHEQLTQEHALLLVRWIIEGAK